MAEILCLGSDSGGNGYVIKTEEEYLFLECGVKPSLFLKAIKHQRNKVAGVLLSHKHGDHAKYAEVLAHDGFDVYSNDDAINAYKLTFPRGRIPTPRRWINIGSFSVYPFYVPHDADNYGYIIRHPEFGRLLFATDTYSIPIIFRGIDHYMIEANYDDTILAQSDISNSQRSRLLTSHMSFDYAKRYLHEAEAENARTITLIHLSSRHSDAPAFKRTMEAEFGIPCNIADRNTIITL